MKITTLTLRAIMSFLFALVMDIAMSQDITSANSPISRFTVQFGIGKSDVDRYYKLNFAVINQMKAYLDTVDISSIDNIRVLGSSSPDGNADSNMRLAFKRAKALRNILVNECNIYTQLLKPDTMEDVGLRIIDEIESDPNFPNKKEILIALKETPSQHRLWMLDFLEYKNVSDYIKRVIYPRLWTASVVVTQKAVNKVQKIEPVIDSKASLFASDSSNEHFVQPTSDVKPLVSAPNVDSLMLPPFTSSSEVQPSVTKGRMQKPLFAFKTNLLFNVASLLNVSLEVPIGQHFSIAGEFIFPWWVNEYRQNCFQVYMGNLEFKYWFQPRENQSIGKFSTMTGWFVGLYGGVGLFDIEKNGKGYQGESMLSTGITGGYAHSIGRSLRMEYSLGVGYMQTHYRKYEAKISPVDNSWDLYRKENGNFSWIGPTQVKISLVWMLNRNVKKGGVIL